MYRRSRQFVVRGKAAGVSRAAGSFSRPCESRIDEERAAARGCPDNWRRLRCGVAFAACECLQADVCHLGRRLGVVVESVRFSSDLLTRAEVREPNIPARVRPRAEPSPCGASPRLFQIGQDSHTATRYLNEDAIGAVPVVPHER